MLLQTTTIYRDYGWGSWIRPKQYRFNMCIAQGQAAPPAYSFLVCRKRAEVQVQKEAN